MIDKEHFTLLRHFLEDLVTKHPEDAIGLLELCFSQAPGDMGFFVQAVDIAAKHKNWLLVVAIGRDILSSGIRQAGLYSTLFDALWNLERAQEAGALLETALEIFPGSPEILLKRARLATMQKDYSRAAPRWIAIQSTFPQIKECYGSGAFCCERAGDINAALRLLENGMSQHPGSVEIWLQYVETLLAAGDIGGAQACWAERQSTFSIDHRAALVGARVAYVDGNLPTARSLLGSSLTLNRGSVTFEQSRLQQDIHRAEMSNLLMQFESLGGVKEGCEFGMVQRAYGAEPLGLLRWSNMVPDALIDALEQNFQGVGEPENTILTAPSGDGDDWMTQDQRYGMRMHTFQRDQNSDEIRVRLFKAACRRLQFLKRKLIADLSAAEKILVYKVSYERLDADCLGRLHRAIRKYGRSTLLYVCQPDDMHAAGTVEWVADGLLIGYIQRFSFEFGHEGKYIGPATEHWVPIIRLSHEYWSGMRDGRLIEVEPRSTKAA